MNISTNVNLTSGANKQTPQFKGTVSPAVIKNIKKLQKEEIRRFIQFANRDGEKVTQASIDAIKSRFANVIETLKNKAKNMLNDTVITYDSGSGRIWAENAKLRQSVNPLERVWHSIKEFRFNDDVSLASYRNIDDLETIVKHINTDDINTIMLRQQRNKLLGTKKTKLSGNLRKQVYDYLLTLKELPPSKRKNDFLATMRDALANNQNKAKIVKENNRFLL